MSPVGSDDDHVDLSLFRRLVDLYFGCSEDKLLAVFFNAEVFRERRQVRRCLLMNLILHRGEIHGDFAAVAEAEWLDDVNNVQFGAKRIGNFPCTTRNVPRILCEIGSQQNALDFGH